MKFFFLFAFLFFVSVGISSAAFPNFDIGFLSPSYNTPTGETAIADYINNFYSFALGISGALAMGMVVYGGIRYATSAGKPDAQSDAKDAIYSALFGIVLLFGSYLILRTVNPKIISLSTSINNPTNCTANQVYCHGTPETTSKCMNKCGPGPNGVKQVFTADCQGTPTAPICKPAYVNCPSTLMATSTCPGAVLLGSRLTNSPGQTIYGRRATDGSSVSVSGGLILAGITDNIPSYDRFYNEDELDIPKYSVIWTYPYFERDDEDKSGAKCVIYAWKEPNGSCDTATFRCSEYEPLEKTDLDQNIKPC